jgi:hypothetical protein
MTWETPVVLQCNTNSVRKPTAIAAALLLIGSDIPKVQLIAQRMKATGKVACRGIAAGVRVRTYGEVIGVANTAILAGDHVHVHNIRSVRT